MTEEKSRRRYVMPVGSALVIVGVAAALIWYFGRREHWDWGDVPTWVGAVATVTALAAAGVGAYFAIQQLGELRKQVEQGRDALALERTRQKEDREDAEKRAKREVMLLEVAARKQAEQIDVEPGSLAVILPGTEGNPGYLALKVQNTSGRPIRDVDCRALLGTGNELKPVLVVHSAIGPQGKDIQGDKTTRIPVTLMRRNTGRNTGFNFVFDATTKRNPQPSYRLRFTDDADQHWELTDEMQLTSIPDRNDW